jgi:hypothetical protein
MGEIQSQPTQLSFKACLKVDFQGSRATSDGSLILVRKLAERLGFGELIQQPAAGRKRSFPSPTRCGNPSIAEGPLSYRFVKLAFGLVFGTWFHGIFNC